LPGSGAICIVADRVDARDVAVPTIFEKLNLKDQREIVVMNSPASFESELNGLQGITVVRDIKKAKSVRFALAFATKQAELDAVCARIVASAEGDAIVWIAYPKGTSKRYHCQFNRDSGWDVLRGAGFDTVRQVAIDNDWTALRFRRLQFVKSARTRTN
jgi:hypothetical protein